MTLQNAMLVSCSFHNLFEVKPHVPSCCKSTLDLPVSPILFWKNIEAFLPFAKILHSVECIQGSSISISSRMVLDQILGDYFRFDLNENGFQLEEGFYFIHLFFDSFWKVVIYDKINHLVLSSHDLPFQFKSFLYQKRYCHVKSSCLETTI